MIVCEQRRLADTSGKPNPLFAMLPSELNRVDVVTVYYGLNHHKF